MRTPLRAAAARAARRRGSARRMRSSGKLLEPAGGVGLEGLLHALLVFSEVEVALRECLSQASGRLLPVAVADAVDCRGGHEAGPFGRM